MFWGEWIETLTQYLKFLAKYYWRFHGTSDALQITFITHIELNRDDKLIAIIIKYHKRSTINFNYAICYRVPLEINTLSQIRNNVLIKLNIL